MNAATITKAIASKSPFVREFNNTNVPVGVPAQLVVAKEEAKTVEGRNLSILFRSDDKDQNGIQVFITAGMLKTILGTAKSLLLTVKYAPHQDDFATGKFVRNQSFNRLLRPQSCIVSRNVTLKGGAEPGILAQGCTSQTYGTFDLFVSLHLLPSGFGDGKFQKVYPIVPDVNFRTGLIPSGDVQKFLNAPELGIAYNVELQARETVTRGERIGQEMSGSIRGIWKANVEEYVTGSSWDIGVTLDHTPVEGEVIEAQGISWTWTSVRANSRDTNIYSVDWVLQPNQIGYVLGYRNEAGDLIQDAFVSVEQVLGALLGSAPKMAYHKVPAPQAFRVIRSRKVEAVEEVPYI